MTKKAENVETKQENETRRRADPRRLGDYTCLRTRQRGKEPGKKGKETQKGGTSREKAHTWRGQEKNKRKRRKAKSSAGNPRPAEPEERCSSALVRLAFEEFRRRLKLHLASVPEVEAA